MADLVSLSSAAHLLKRPYESVRRDVIRGALPGERRNGHWFVDLQFLLEVTPKVQSQDREKPCPR